MDFFTFIYLNTKTSQKHFFYAKSFGAKKFPRSKIKNILVRPPLLFHSPTRPHRPHSPIDPTSIMAILGVTKSRVHHSDFMFLVSKDQGPNFHPNLNHNKICQKRESEYPGWGPIRSHASKFEYGHFFRGIMRQPLQSWGGVAFFCRPESGVARTQLSMGFDA